MPVVYSPADFTPLREMKIVFSPELLMDMLVDKTAEEVEKEMRSRILKSVEEALDGGLKENVPYELGLIFRLSSRSIKKMCKEYNRPTMCINPRWQRQEDLLQRLPDFLAVLSTGQPIDIYDL